MTGTQPAIGTIGGGQLAWMMGIAATRLGIPLAVQAASLDEPAVAIASHVVLGAVDDAAATATLANHCHVITFENEFVDIPSLQHLAAAGVEFIPPLPILDLLVDKLTQRQFLRQQGIPVPEFLPVETISDLQLAASQWGYPVVLKARRHGYDGRGTWIATTESELLAAWEGMGRAPALVEAFVPFRRELAIMAARSRTGEIALYPVVQTQQERQVCRRVVTLSGNEQVNHLARAFLAALSAPGLFGLELFECEDGTVLVNEIAPRPHNSGHYTIEACETSQFEQLVRLAAGLPLGNTAMRVPAAVMVNLLGLEDGEADYEKRLQRISNHYGTTLHWYGKTQSRPGRKLGHATVVCHNVCGARAHAAEIEAIWYGEAARG